MFAWRLGICEMFLGFALENILMQSLLNRWYKELEGNPIHHSDAEFHEILKIGLTA
jgi:hypothetical protein